MKKVEECDFIERCIYKILNDKKLNYLEKSYIHITLEKRKEEVKKQDENTD